MFDKSNRKNDTRSTSSCPVWQRVLDPQHAFAICCRIISDVLASLLLRRVARAVPAKQRWRHATRDTTKNTQRLYKHPCCRQVSEEVAGCAYRGAVEATTPTNFTKKGLVARQARNWARRLTAGCTGASCKRFPFRARARASKASRASLQGREHRGRPGLSRYRSRPTAGAGETSRGRGVEPRRLHRPTADRSA